jgi:hypothetical protein
MSVTQSVRQTAARAGNSRWLERLTRAGFIGYGLLHLVVAWLAIQIAQGKPGVEGDQTGAFQLLEQQPSGRLLLILIIVGLVAMALWQLTLAAVGHRDETGWHRPAERFLSLTRTIVYAVLAWTAAWVLMRPAESSAAKQQEATGSMLAQPAGRWLVAIAGLAILGTGVCLAVYGWRRMFERRLRTGEMSWDTRKAVIALGRVGYIAKGVAYGIVGWLVVQAAVSYDPSRARGLDAALRTIAAEPYGMPLLILVAIGMAAFGVYCFFQSKYRKI